MPQDIDWKESKVIKADNEINWTKYSGRTVYEMDSLTGLNQIPVDTHAAFVLSGEDVVSGEPLIEPDDIALACIVEGTVVLRFNDPARPDQPDYVMENIVPVASTSRFKQEIEAKTLDGRKITRVWQLVKSVWKWTDYVAFGSPNEQIIDTAKEGVSADYIKVYTGGSGILYRSQFTFRRLEEIESKIRGATNEALSVIIAGYAGNRNQMQAAIEGDGRFLNIPSHVDVYPLATTAVVDQYLSDFGNLVSLYNKRTFMVEMNDSSTASGVARRLVMAPTLNYVQTIRRRVQGIYDDMNVELQFDKIVTSTIEERIRELDLLDRLYDNGKGPIEEEEYRDRARGLIL